MDIDHMDNTERLQLYCQICDTYFDGQQSKIEHMNSKQHLNNVHFKLTESSNNLFQKQSLSQQQLTKSKTATEHTTEQQQTTSDCCLLAHREYFDINSYHSKIIERSLQSNAELKHMKLKQNSFKVEIKKSNQMLKSLKQEFDKKQTVLNELSKTIINHINHQQQHQQDQVIYISKPINQQQQQQQQQQQAQQIHLNMNQPDQNNFVNSVIFINSNEALNNNMYQQQPMLQQQQQIYAQPQQQQQQQNFQQQQQVQFIIPNNNNNYINQQQQQPQQQQQQIMMMQQQHQQPPQQQSIYLNDQYNLNNYVLTSNNQLQQ